MRKAKLIFACGREPSYIRNALFWQTLQAHFDSQLIGDEHGRSLTFRLARVAARLLYRLRSPHDLVVIGFYGHPLVLLAKRFTRAPILFDPFVSTYDTLSLDRAYFAPTSLWARFCFQLDRQALTKATVILADTQTHAEFYHTTFQIAPHKFEKLYLGCDERQFYPQPAAKLHEPFTVFTYSTYMPLHGMETIVQAAHHCQSLPLRFQLVGDRGPTYQAVRRKAADLNIKNVDFTAYMPFHQLPAAIASASICLGGHFGATAKADRVIAGKTYQFIAMAKPVILGDTRANRELFAHGTTAFLTPPGDPERLAAAIQTLYQDAALRQCLAQNAYQLFDRRLTWAVLEQQLLQAVNKALTA